MGNLQFFPEPLALCVLPSYPCIVPIHFLEDKNFRAGATVLIDKPLGWTSFDVVNKIKYTLKHHMGFKKIKVGHAGTLDPLATGVLVVCMGKMTKQIESIMAGEKEYTGRIRFGQTTPSFDLETEPEGDFSTSHLNLHFLQEKAKTLTGEIIQYPPVFSAKKINGKRAFQYARKGEEVKVRPNAVEVKEFELSDFGDDSVKFRVRCSKGTYIRSLANDLGKLAESGAYLTELRRTASGEFTEDQCSSVEEVVSFIESLEPKEQT